LVKVRSHKIKIFSLYCHFPDIIDIQRHSTVEHVDVTERFE